MIHELVTRLSCAFLAFQGGHTLPQDMTEAELEKFMSTVMPIYLIIGLIALIVGIWMVIDAWNNYGAGWGILSCVGCLFFSWIAIIIYLIVRFAAAPPDKYRYKESSGAQGYNAPPVYGGGAKPAPQDIELAPQEHDERIDEMLAQGKGREAMDYAQQMFKMAQDFKDTSGQARYRKYIERIRMGIK